MKKYTQAEFDAFEIDEDGRRICPTGDYSEIKSFGERCSFGEWCRFGEGCSFGEWCSFGEGCKAECDKPLKQTYKFEGFGSRRRCTYAFLLTDNTFFIRCGCFSGTLEEFKAKVKETHAGTIYEAEYNDVIYVIENILKRAKEQENETTEN